MSRAKIATLSPRRIEAEVIALGTFVTLAESLVVTTDPSSGTAEAIRALRTALVAQHFQAGRRALAVCAPSAGAGCSFVASNLALALSQIGLRTLLLDANLRDPSLQTIFRPSQPRGGLIECLASDVEEFSSYVQQQVQPNLAVMYAGTTVANPQELLAGQRFHNLIEFCLREFDATILDTSPANTCADALRVGSVIGYGLVVARRNVSYVEDVRVLAAQLGADRARVVGYVLNEA